MKNIADFFAGDLEKPNTSYFILDTKGRGTYGDVDFIKYEWSPSFYNLLKEGDLFLYRRPRRASETGDFYFFGACRIKHIVKVEKDRASASFDKMYPFERYVRREDIEDYIWAWKARRDTWEHFFNQYGMNKIPKEDFVGILLRSGEYDLSDEIDIHEEVKAIQSIQSQSFFAPDASSVVKVRARQKAFADKVKANYKFACCVCGLANRDFLIGAHIVPWSERKDIRLNPGNGLCLCALHDRAFEHGYLALTDDYKILVRKDVGNDKVLNKLLSPLKGKRIKLPGFDRPWPEFLDWHRENNTAGTKYNLIRCLNRYFL